MAYGKLSFVPGRLGGSLIEVVHSADLKAMIFDILSLVAALIARYPFAAAARSPL